MRLLHTSDWHLGRTLHGVDLADAQARVLDGLVALVDAHDVDAVVVAGDVHDRAVPPVESVRLFERTLDALSARVPVVVVSGNHDSAIRLGYGASMFRSGVHVATGLEWVGRPVELSDQHGPVLVYPIPFLDPDDARVRLRPPGRDEPLPRSHEAVMAAAMARVRADLAARTAAGGRVRSVVVAHAFVVGGSPSDSERDIRVGGVDTVPTAVFAGVDYVALGHLHGPQEPASPDGVTRLRYAGSPLRYSFSECRQTKSVTLVDLGPDGVVGVELVPVPQPRGMAVLTGRLDTLLGEESLAAHADDWLTVVVTDARRPERLFERVRARFPHAVRVLHEPAAQPGTAPAAPAGRDVDPVEMAEAFVRYVTGTDPTEAEVAAVRQAYERVLAGQRSA